MPKVDFLQILFPATLILLPRLTGNLLNLKTIEKGSRGAPRDPFSIFVLNVGSHDKTGDTFGILYPLFT